MICKTNLQKVVFFGGWEEPFGAETPDKNGMEKKTFEMNRVRVLIRINRLFDTAKQNCSKYPYNARGVAPCPHGL